MGFIEIKGIGEKREKSKGERDMKRERGRGRDLLDSRELQRERELSTRILCVVLIQKRRIVTKSLCLVHLCFLFENAS